MLDMDYIENKTEGNTEDNDECSAEEIEYLAKLWDLKLELDKL